MTTTIARLALLLGFVFADEPSWNYDNAGTDWTMDSCDPTGPGVIESPANLSYDNMGIHSDWVEYAFAFLPYFREGQSSEYGVENWVYKIKSDQFGILNAAEPFYYAIGDYKITWEVEELRFHYPAEHTVNGTAADLEMQIIFKPQGAVLLC